MRQIRFFQVFLLLCVMNSCQKEPGVDPAEKQFNIVKFQQLLVDSMSGQVPGFAYAINFKRQPYSKGAEGFSMLSPAVPFKPDSRMQVASVSKTITAATVLKVLSLVPGLTIDSPVAPYFPNHWTPGPNVEKLTFRNLLNHRSGFPEIGGKGYYSHLQQLVEGGLTEADRGKTFNYNNENYSLFRILLPILSGLQPHNVTSFDSIPLAWAYMQLVHELLFTPMGIDQAYCKQLSNQFIEYFNCANGNRASGSDHTARCGAYGWNLSAYDLSVFMAHLRYNNDIFDGELRATMDSNFLGWENEHSSANGEHGTYLFHSGQFHYGESDAGGLRTCIMKYPANEVEVVLVMNCVDHPHPNIASPRKLLKIIYDQSWE